MHLGLLLLLQFIPPPIPPPASITPAMLQSDAPGDGECLTYDLATTAFIWGPCGSGGGAPTDATYITQTHSAGLSAEQAMGDLSTGLIKNTTTTGVQSIYAGTSCTNQFPRSLDASGAATCASVALATDVSGSLGVGNGGTGGSTTATSGRYLRGNGSTWATSSVAAAGAGACSTGEAVTAGVDNAAPTCDGHVMFDNEANTVTQDMTFDDGSGASPIVSLVDHISTRTFEVQAVAGELDLSTSDDGTSLLNIFSNGSSGLDVMNVVTDGILTASNYPSGASDDQVLVATNSTASAWKTLPNGAVSYGTSFNTFSQAGINNLASSTSSDLATVLSDEVGTGKALFANSLLVVTGSNFTTTNTANQTITGLSWSGTSGTNYWVRCNLAVTGTATGGPRISVTSSGSSTTISYGIRGHTTSATTQTYTGGSASGTQSASCTSGCLTTDIPFDVDLMVRPSASVTLAIAAANSTSGQTTTVKIGSSCLVLTP